MKNAVKKITFNNEYRCFKKGFSFEPIEGLNIIVGDQGCGKSSLLELLSKNDPVLDVILIDEVYAKGGVETFYFDSEKHNPRTKDPNLYTNPNGEDKGIGFANALLSRHASHGEILVGFTVNALKKAENAIIFIDEPESGLSIKNQFELIKALKAAVEADCQIFVATHCFPLINESEKVYSLEHKKWMKGKEYINSIKRRNNVKGSISDSFKTDTVDEYRNEDLVLKNLRDSFYNDSLTTEDLKNVNIIENVEVKYDSHPYPNAFFIDYGNQYFVKDSGLLDGKSKKLIHSYKRKTILCNILVIKRGSILWNEYLTKGFYKFNSSMSLPDSILAVKFLKIR